MSRLRPGFVLAWPALYVYFRCFGKQRTRVLITYQGQLLLVREAVPFLADLDHWGLPGGGIRRRESLLAAAARELQEELSLRVDQSALRLLGTQPSTYRGLTYQASFCHVELTTQPPLKLQRHEVASAQWFTLAEVSQLPLQPSVRAGLALLAAPS